MDNVLFYGERDEQTRRQVRSAAAAHSHRIGPRKPKATLRQSASSGSGSASGGGGGGGGGSSSSKDTPPKRRTAQQKHAVVVKQEASPSTASSPPNVHVRDMYRAVPSGSQFRDAPAPVIGTTTAPLHMYPPHLPRGTSDPPPRNGAASPGLRSTSPAQPTTSSTSPDVTQRLPQYSWTEYPRYGLGSHRVQSRDMLADVASSARSASRSGSPAEQGIPGLRHFESSAEGRPILPPLLPTSCPHAQQGVDGGRPIVSGAEAQARDAAPPPPSSRQAAQDPCLAFVQHPRPHWNPSSPG